MKILSNRLSKMRSVDPPTSRTDQLTFEIPKTKRNIKQSLGRNSEIKRLNLRKSLKVHKKLNLPISKRMKGKNLWNRKIEQMRKQLMSLSQDSRQSVKRKTSNVRKMSTFENNKLEKMLETHSMRNEGKAVKSQRNSRRESFANIKSKKTSNRFKVDLKKLEENLRLGELRCRVKDKERRSKNSSKFTSSISNRLLENTYYKKSGKEKVKIATYLKTERPGGRDASRTPKALKREHHSTKVINLQTLCLNKKSRENSRKTNGRPRPKGKRTKSKLKDCTSRRKTGSRQKGKKTSRPKTEHESVTQYKKSVNSLNLSKRPKKLSKEETLLVLKSLESDRRAKRLLSDIDLFFLKDSKIRKRTRKKQRFSSKETKQNNFIENLKGSNVNVLNSHGREKKRLKSKRKNKKGLKNRKLNFTEGIERFESRTNQYNSIQNQKASLIQHFKLKFKTRPVNELVSQRDKSAAFCPDKKRY